MSEIQAAMGLLQLKYIDKNIYKRHEITQYYGEWLNKISGIKLLNDIPNVKHNYSYLPIFVDVDKYGISRDELYENLKEHNTYTRRYFYPLISQFPTYRGLESAQPGKLPVAEKAADQVICLPLYPELQANTIDSICSFIKK